MVRPGQVGWEAGGMEWRGKWKYGNEIGGLEKRDRVGKLEWEGKENGKR